MKSQTRAWLVCIVLFVLWGTLAAAPFQYFSDLIRELGGFACGNACIAGCLEDLSGLSAVRCCAGRASDSRS